MLNEEDKAEIGRIARQNIRLGMFFNDLRGDLMALLANPDDEKEKYYSWSILAHDYFVNLGKTNMMEELVEILDSKYSNHEMWKQLEEDFLKKYGLWGTIDFKYNLISLTLIKNKYKILWIFFIKKGII